MALYSVVVCYYNSMETRNTIAVMLQSSGCVSVYFGMSAVVHIVLPQKTSHNICT